MLEFKFKQVTLIFDFSFFAVVSLMLLFSNNKYVIMCVLACLWHETGHLLAMLLNNIKINKICLYGGGIRISPDKMFDFTPAEVRFKVLLAGSAMNFVTFLVLKNSQSDMLCFFAAINAMIGGFNMLPLQFLDGGKIIVQVIRSLCTYQHSVVLERYLKWMNVVMILAIMICLAFVGKGNLTLFITLFLLLVSAISDS
ncbi:MAG: hypothetical protein J6A05_02635 [Oscillospiraceae bacterium]|nr:hypothetical protein [Oscillospiraceae bacterium]